MKHMVPQFGSLLKDPAGPEALLASLKALGILIY